jgi:acyl-CoA dehydrogenase
MVDQHGVRAARTEIAGVKVAMPTVLADISRRAMHLHGALGVSNEMPFSRMVTAAAALGLADGPTEVHKSSIARALLKEAQPSPTGWPSAHLPERTAAARERFADLLEREQANR